MDSIPIKSTLVKSTYKVLESIGYHEQLIKALDLFDSDEKQGSTKKDALPDDIYNCHVFNFIKESNLDIYNNKRNKYITLCNEQLDRDALMIYGAFIDQNNPFDKEYGFYRFIGTEISDTRDFCKEKMNKYFHEEEIKSWSLENWDGKAVNTNSENIFYVRGGYGCRHRMLSVSPLFVPVEDIKRFINKGFYKPTDKQKEYFGL